MDVTKTTQNTKVNVRLIVGTGMLSALAFVLQYLEFPLPIMPGFIKFDFSDLPALIGAFAYGPVAGILVEFIKNLLHCTVTQSFTVGELSNFILGAIFTGTAGLIYKKNKTKKGAVIGAIVGSLAMGIISFPSNLFVVYPAYNKFMPMDAIIGMYSEILPSVGKLWQALLIFNVPFTIVKGLVSTLITVLIYKRISPILKGKN
ncbi:ECF transporter S component [Agathobacter sp.]